jgi:hypothetical protein
MIADPQSVNAISFKLNTARQICSSDWRRKKCAAYKKAAIVLMTAADRFLEYGSQRAFGSTSTFGLLRHVWKTVGSPLIF